MPIQVLSDEEPLIRHHLAWALEALWGRTGVETDAWVPEEVRMAPLEMVGYRLDR